MKFFVDEKIYESVIQTLEKELAAARAAQRDLLDQNRELTNKLLAVSNLPAYTAITKPVVQRDTSAQVPPKRFFPGHMPNRRPPVNKES